MDNSSVKYLSQQALDRAKQKDLDVIAAMAARDAVVRQQNGQAPLPGPTAGTGDPVPPLDTLPGAPPLPAPSAPSIPGASPNNPLGLSGMPPAVPTLSAPPPGAPTPQPVPAAAMGGEVMPMHDSFDAALPQDDGPSPFDQALAEVGDPVERKAPEPHELLPGVRSAPEMMGIFLKLLSGEKVDPEALRQPMPAIEEPTDMSDEMHMSNLPPAPPEFIHWLQTTQPTETNDVGADLLDAYESNPEMVDAYWNVVTMDAQSDTSALPPDLKRMAKKSSLEDAPDRPTPTIPNVGKTANDGGGTKSATPKLKVPTGY